MSRTYQSIPKNSPRFRVWRFLHPDGDFMFFHTEKKMKSMVNNNLAKVIDEESRVVQLTFIPKGKGCAEDDIFMKHPKDSKCVICGTYHNLTRHHVVPKVFRKHFYSKYKESNSHDIVFACIDCHEKYERKADILKSHYYYKYNIESTSVIEVKIISKLKLIYGCIRDLENKLYSGNKYWFKVDYKIKRLLNFNQEIPFTMSQISYLKNLYSEKLKTARKFFKDDASSKILVEKIIEEDKLEDFVRTWRKHFLDNAQPKFMPLGWSVERKIYQKENL